MNLILAQDRIGYPEYFGMHNVWCTFTYSSVHTSISYDNHFTFAMNQNNGQANPASPLVVLAGWLGCKPSSLKRYSQLYKSLGFQVRIEIASPLSIVRTSLVADDETIHQHAVDIVNALYSEYSHCCSYIILHVFSNGGCFLYEAIRDLALQVNHKKKQKDIDNNAQKFFREIHGIVYDSAPAYYRDNQELLQNALKYCTIEDRRAVQSYLDKQEKNKLPRGKKIQRANEYWNIMMQDRIKVMKLFVLSKNDALTPFKPLWELIEHQKKLHGNRINTTVFTESDHCRHLLNFEREYINAIRGFVKKIEIGRISAGKNIQSRI